jgi:hypothetical protein
MLETPHVAAGAAISYFVPNPAIAIPLALLSHFVLDGIPHWNPHLNTELKNSGKISKNSLTIVIVDSALALTLGGFLAIIRFPNSVDVFSTLACSFAAVLPDVIEAPYFFLNIKNRAVEKWTKFQKNIQANTGIVLGITTQIITVAAALLWIFSKKMS